MSNKKYTNVIQYNKQPQKRYLFTDSKKWCQLSLLFYLLKMCLITDSETAIIF